MNYKEFIESKQIRFKSSGKEIDVNKIHPFLFDFQKDIVHWAVKKGKCAIFLDTGLGKTYVLAEFARMIGENTLIIAPLSVARQTVRLVKNIDMEIRYVRSMAETKPDHKYYITNYEMIDDFDFDYFPTVICDESSLFKSIGGKTKRKLIDLCQHTSYKLACTATPAPNDLSEIGNHAEFLSICSFSEMLAMFFIHANIQEEIVVGNRVIKKKFGNKHGQEWRIKNHAYEQFYKWLASWSVSMRKPSDLDYDDNGFILPPLNINPIFLESETEYVPEGELFFSGIKGFSDITKVKRATIAERIEKVKQLTANNQQFIIWCWLQQEADELKKHLDDCVEIRGSDSIEFKSKLLEDFQDGKYRILITKPKIAGFGINLQNAHNMIFFSLSHSWEMYYQCIRREYRFGQDKPVNVYLLISKTEMEIYDNILKKERIANSMKENLISHIKLYEEKEIGKIMETEQENYRTREESGDGWRLLLGDSCERLKEIKDESVHLSVYSPPFADLYTYSPSLRDLGNCLNWDEFFGHYAFIIREVLRVTIPGRLSCVHVSDIPAMGIKDGYIGLKDFPGKVIEAHEKGGWILHGRILINKNPQLQAIRTKSKALLFVQMKKDSTDSRPALVDHVLVFKKHGENRIPVTPVENGELDNELWINWANGIWMDISEGDVLKHGYNHGRSEDDEKHICPLQLGTIERCIKLYSNKKELVLTPFLGIGSEAYQAIRFGRQAIGIELKESYFDIAVKNLKYAEYTYKERDLFTPLVEAEQAA